MACTRTVFLLRVQADSKAAAPPAAFRYTLPDEGFSGKVELTFFDSFSKGVACNLDSPGYKAVKHAFTEQYGTFQPLAITGSLPCIRELQDNGFDVQMMGFGK